ncbi:MAG: CPBP family intramembrane metalloprotease [Clostridiales Family XIII bacterium]|jgi:membrane protease YdiL (CAAX protease family)|nr:CPBP family intramembrane metalloprotease [Clostridiales Family XIII bacterium]
MDEYGSNTRSNNNGKDAKFVVPGVPYEKLDDRDSIDKFSQLNDPESLFKRAIRRETMVIFFLLVGFYVISTLVDGIVTIISQTFTWEVNGSTAIPDAISEADSVNVGLISILGMAAGMLLFLALRGKRLFTTDITDTRDKMQAGLFIKLYVVAMGAQLIFGIVSTAVEYILSRFGLSALTLYEASMNALITPLGLLYAMLLGPIMEEIIFRGAIMKQLERFGANYAIVISSLIFALYHLFVFQAVFAFFVGIILAYTAHKYSLKWSMLLHILINSSALGLESVLGENLFSVLMLAFLIAAIVILAKNRHIIKTQIAAGKPVMPHAFKYAFSGGFMIAMFVIFVAVNTGIISFSSNP